MGILLSESPEPNRALDAPSASVFHPVVDRLLHLTRGDRVAWLSNVKWAIERFPELARFDRRALLRGIAITDATNRIVFRLHNKFPRLAKLSAYLVPIDLPIAFRKDVPRDRPIVIALMHFGPIHYGVAVAMRLFPDRRMYVLHAGGETGEPVARYLRGIGSFPIVADRKSLKKIEAEVTEHPASTVLVAFDHLAGSLRHVVPFLGATLPVAIGLSYLADRRDALVVPCWLEFTRKGPRLRVAEPCEIDRRIPAGAQRDDLTERMTRLLEERVKAAPHQWTEWAHCRAADIVKQERPNFLHPSGEHHG